MNFFISRQLSQFLFLLVSRGLTPFYARHYQRTVERLSPVRKPTIQIEHHKTGAVIEHPLEEKLEDNSIVKFYEEAE
jgi:hypothetical protein